MTAPLHMLPVYYIVTCQAHPVLVKSGSNVRFFFNGPKDPWPRVLSLPGAQGGFVGDPTSLTRDNMFQVTRDAVHILASEVDLFEGSDLIDPCKDLYLEVVMLRIKVHLKHFNSNLPLIWKRYCRVVFNLHRVRGWSWKTRPFFDVGTLCLRWPIISYAGIPQFAI